MDLRKCLGPLHKGAEIDLSFFGLNQKACRACKRLYNKARYEAKREKIILQVKAYRKTHPDLRQRARDPYIMPIEKRIWLDLQKDVQRILTGYPYHFKSLENLIGIGQNDFLAYVQTCLSRGMNLGNYGRAKLKWEIQNNISPIGIDFRQPQAQFDFFHWRNLKPVWYRRAKKQKTPFPNEKRVLEAPREIGLGEAA